MLEAAMTVNLTEITQLPLQLAQWHFLECEVLPQQAIFGRFLLGILVAQGSGLPPEGGTPVPDDRSCTKTGTVPGSGLVLDVAAVGL